jgi:hypothetical protein
LRARSFIGFLSGRASPTGRALTALLGGAGFAGILTALAALLTLAPAAG